MLRVLVFLLLSFVLQGQVVHQHYTLDLKPDSGLVTGRWTAELHFATSTPDTLVVEFPALGIIKEHTSYRNQRIEEQEVDLHFARKTATGSLNNLELRVNDQPANWAWGTSEDLLYLFMEPGVQSLELTLAFSLYLPDASFQGWGKTPDGMVIRNALPHLSRYENGSFWPAPLRKEEDQNAPPLAATLEVTYPSTHDLVGPTGLSVATTEPGVSVATGTIQPTRAIPLLLARKWVSIPVDLPQGTATLIMPAESMEDPAPWKASLLQVNAFYARELGQTLHGMKVVVSSFAPWTPCGGVLVVASEENHFPRTRNLAEQMALHLFADQSTAAGFEHPWLTKGLAAFYVNRFVEKEFPDEKLLGWVSKTIVARFFALDAYKWDYQNQLYYLFMARQGLDQPIQTRADSLARFNYKGMVEGKFVMALEYLQDYVGEARLNKGLRTYLQRADLAQNPEGLQAAMEKTSYRKLDWFFGPLLTTNAKADYALTGYDTCPTVTTATVKNKGTLDIPFPITGTIGDSTVVTEWYPGFRGKQSVPLYAAPYTKIFLDMPQHMPELRLQNNQLKPGWLKVNTPLKLQFFNSLEDPRRTQVFWTPIANFNAYDLFLVGASFYNNTLVPKRFEYRIAPAWSTGTSSLTGSVSAVYNIIPNGTPFHRVSVGMYGRYYHYDTDLAYWRLSPTVNFLFRRSYPRSEDQHSVRVRLVHLDRETRPGQNPSLTDVNRAAYTVFDARYKWENANILRPFTLMADYQLADGFSKVSLEADFRKMLFNRQWAALRVFAGAFTSNKNPDQNTYYNFGMSGTTDYLFDYYLIGRSDETGVWSRQFFVSDGGMKAFASQQGDSLTNLFSSTWLVGINLNLPIWSIFGVYSDLGFLPLPNGQVNAVADFGIRIAIVPDFVEAYFPLAHSEYDVLNGPSPYWKGVRFVLNLQADAIINRWRRGRF